MIPLTMSPKVKQLESLAFSRFFVKHFELVSKTLPLCQISAPIRQPQISVELLLNQSEIGRQLSQLVSKDCKEVKREFETYWVK